METEFFKTESFKELKRIVSGHAISGFPFMSKNASFMGSKLVRVWTGFPKMQMLVSIYLVVIISSDALRKWMVSRTILGVQG